MKVILSADSVRYPLTGIGRYTYELSRQLELRSEIEELRFFAGRKFLDGLPEPSNMPTATHSIKRFLQKSSLVTQAYQFAMPVCRAWELREHKDFIYHGPNFFLPPFEGKKVATFHDLSPFTWSHCHEPVKVKYMQKELCKTLMRADALITDSEFTRRELAAFSGWPIEKIFAVPLASSTDFSPRTEEQVKTVLDKYGLKYQAYTFFVGTIEPRKNIATLLDAYGRLPLKQRRCWPLIISGYHGWESENIHQRIKNAENEGWARYLGFLPAAELPALYAGARLFAFPSLYEGFGLPVIEAMSSGVPVVCSNSSSLPEVTGNAALMCEPLDVEALSVNLQIGLDDEKWRNDAILAGLEQSSLFSFERCARETVEVYSRCLAN